MLRLRRLSGMLIVLLVLGVGMPEIAGAQACLPIAPDDREAILRVVAVFMSEYWPDIPQPRLTVNRVDGEWANVTVTDPATGIGGGMIVHRVHGRAWTIVEGPTTVLGLEPAPGAPASVYEACAQR